MKKLTLLILGLASLALASCNTIAGAGRDITRGGEAISNTARNAAN